MGFYDVAIISWTAVVEKAAPREYSSFVWIHQQFWPIFCYGVSLGAYQHYCWNLLAPPTSPLPSEVTFAGQLQSCSIFRKQMATKIVIWFYRVQDVTFIHLEVSWYKFVVPLPGDLVNVWHFLEVLSSKVPYHCIKNEVQIITLVLKGVRLPHPDDPCILIDTGTSFFKHASLLKSGGKDRRSCSLY